MGETLYKYFWLIGIGFIGFVLLYHYHHAKLYLKEKPEIKNRTISMYWYIFIYFFIVFVLSVVSRFGKEELSVILENDVKKINIWEKLSNVVAIFFFLKGTYWMFIKKGALFLSQHPQVWIKPIFNVERKISQYLIKTCWLIVLFANLYSCISELYYNW